MARIIIVLLLMSFGIFGIGCTFILNNGGEVETDKGEPNYGIRGNSTSEPDTNK